MGFRQDLQEHGEVEVELENDRTAELHLDAEFSSEGDSNRTVVSFTDHNNEEHSFYADAVVDWSTHTSHFVGE